MKRILGVSADTMLVAIVFAILGWTSLCSVPVQAQEGQNAVYNGSASCCVASGAFIDATPFAGTSTTICSVLNTILNSATSAVVIDARGLSSANTSMTCVSTLPSPWYGISNPPPSTILLPATTASASIYIPSTWVLPSNTHLIGEGDGTSGTPGTTIEAVSPLISIAGPFIQFGSSSLCSSPCTGISIERLTINGQGTSTNGIVNAYAGQASFVDHVTLYQVRGTGLLVGSSTASGFASGSGPYSNITFDTGTYSGTTGTVCAQILNVVGGTRGIHGLFCHSETNDAPAGVLLDSSNNSITDVTIRGFDDGIRVGANGTAQSNVLLNITGDTTFGSTGAPINTVHITTNSTVTDLSIMGASNSGVSGTTTIKDNVTSTTISDTTVGIYALGESPSGGVGYSRFTTSPSEATWAQGSSSPSGTCARGSVYSCTGTSSACSGKALWSCLASPTYWQGVM